MEQQDKLEEKPFYKRWTFWFVCFYLLFILIYTIAFNKSSGENVLLASNELGDFLAGVFAPLAFLFLYLGYKQQGDQLKQQGIELANSVAEQKNLIRIHKEEQRDKHFQVLPCFKILKQNVKRYTHPYMLDDDEGNIIDAGEEEILEISFELMNYGEVARNVLIKSIQNQQFYRNEEYKLDHEKCLKILLKFDEQTIEILEKGSRISNTLELTYTNIYGKPYKEYIHYNVSFYQCPEECETYPSLSVEIQK